MRQNTPQAGDHHRRHVFIWKLLLLPMRLLLRIRFNHTAQPADVKGPFLFVCNHCTDWDPMLAGSSFSQQIYFVTSEHILRVRLAGALIRWLQDPIPRQKGGSAADTVMTMLRRLKKGYNVGLFPEGNRSWDGTTGEFLPSIGKLARSSGASLVTYRLEGGYFSSPRWAGASLRRGRMTGHVVRVYRPEELRAMTPDQINAHIREDLWEDAYARQRQDPVPFRGKKLAEHLERLLFMCPRCGGIHTLHSQGDTVSCTQCGLSFQYLPTGFLAGEGLPWDTIRDGNLWQKEQIARLCAQAEDGPIFTDTDMETREVHFSQDTVFLARGDMRLYRDRLELPGVTIPLASLTGIALQGPQDIYFGAGNRSYLVRSDAVRCTVKYLTACSCLNGGAHYGV